MDAVGVPIGVVVEETVGEAVPVSLTGANTDVQGGTLMTSVSSEIFPDVVSNRPNTVVSGLTVISRSARIVPLKSLPAPSET